MVVKQADRGVGQGSLHDNVGSLAWLGADFAELAEEVLLSISPGVDTPLLIWIIVASNMLRFVACLDYPCRTLVKSLVYLATEIAIFVLFYTDVREDLRTALYVSVALQILLRIIGALLAAGSACFDTRCCCSDQEDAEPRAAAAECSPERCRISLSVTIFAAFLQGLFFISPAMAYGLDGTAWGGLRDESHLRATWVELFILASYWTIALSFDDLALLVCVMAMRVLAAYDDPSEYSDVARADLGCDQKELSLFQLSFKEKNMVDKMVTVLSAFGALLMCVCLGVIQLVQLIRDLGMDEKPHYDRVVLITLLVGTATLMAMFACCGCCCFCLLMSVGMLGDEKVTDTELEVDVEEAQAKVDARDFVLVQRGQLRAQCEQLSALAGKIEEFLVTEEFGEQLRQPAVERGVEAAGNLPAETGETAGAAEDVVTDSDAAAQREKQRAQRELFSFLAGAMDLQT